MSQLLTEPEPRLRRWTRDEFYRLADLGLFEGQRAELIEGTIMVLSPQKWPHSSGVDRIAETLRPAFGAGFWVRMQLPLHLGLNSNPEPDISVVPGRRDDYTDHPTLALLIAEVSDTTLAFDRGEKAAMVARAGIADCWIINRADDQVEVYRKPVLDPALRWGAGYVNRLVLTRGQAASPLAAPTTLVSVDDLLG